MIPHARQSLGFLIDRLLSSTLPELQTVFAMSDVAMIATLLRMFGQDFDRSAQARLEDIREMQDIFSDAKGLVKDPALAARLAREQDEYETNMGIEALDAVHAEHCALLIQTHAAVELIDTRAAAVVNRAIWAHLERHAERHRYDVDFG